MGIQKCPCPVDRLEEWIGQTVQVDTLCGQEPPGELVEVTENYIVLDGPPPGSQVIILCCHICSIRQQPGPPA